jgi:transcriptional regulator NrdR family protein
MPSLSLRAKVSVVAVLLAFVGVFALAWQLRRQHQQRALAVCRELRSEISDLKTNTFDPRLEEMRTMRLNPSQAETLRNADPDAYARFAATYGQLVEQVAQAADRLGEKVDLFQSKGCVDLGPAS